MANISKYITETILSQAQDPEREINKTSIFEVKRIYCLIFLHHQVPIFSWLKNLRPKNENELRLLMKHNLTEISNHQTTRTKTKYLIKNAGVRKNYLHAFLNQQKG